jgi:hypothetical protein
MNSDDYWRQQEEERKSLYRFQDARARGDYGAVAREVSTDASLVYYGGTDASTGGSVRDDSPGYGGALSRANGTKNQLLNRIAEAIAKCQPLRYPSPLSQFSVLNPEYEAALAREHEELNILYQWVSSLDPAIALTQTLVHNIRERWRPYDQIFYGLWAFEWDVVLVEHARILRDLA